DVVHEIRFGGDVWTRVGRRAGCAPAVEADAAENAGRAEGLREAIVDDGIRVPDLSRDWKLRRITGVDRVSIFVLGLAALDDTDVAIPLANLELEQHRRLERYGEKHFARAVGEVEAVDRQVLIDVRDVVRGDRGIP